MHVVFVQIYFSVGAIKYRSISETITSMEYVTMLCLQGSTRNFCYLTAGGGLCFFVLRQYCACWEKDGVRELLGGGKAETISR